MSYFIRCDSKASLTDVFATLFCLTLPQKFWILSLHMCCRRKLLFN